MQNFNELNYFLTLAQTQSFVKAGQLLGISSSALSHSMKNLETRLNLRLFNRTTRNVSLTEAGQQLFEQLFPLYQAINHEVDALNDFLNKPSGLIRINAPAMAVEAVLYPKLKPILNQYPKIRLEIVVDDRWADIVKEGFDMGVRLGNEVAKEMIAVPISAPLKMALVASPDYSELDLNQYSVGSPCRTICTVCGSPHCPDLNLIHYIWRNTVRRKILTICSSTASSARSSPPNTARRCSGNSNTKKS